MRKNLHQSMTLGKKLNKLKGIAHKKTSLNQAQLFWRNFLLILTIFLFSPDQSFVHQLGAATVSDPITSHDSHAIKCSDFNEKGMYKAFFMGPNDPMAPLEGFNVLVKNNATFQGGEIEGPVAIWNQLTMDGTFNIAIANPGTYIVPGDANPTALIVEGPINFASGNGINLLNNSLVKLKDLTGVVVHDMDNGNPTNTRITANGFNDIPKIQVGLHQPAANVGPADVFNFSGAFNTLQVEANNLFNYGNNVNTQVQGAGRLRLLVQNNRLNVWNVSASTLGSLVEINLSSAPSASSPLLINVTTGTDFTWNIPNFPGLADSHGQYIIWNFANTTGTINLNGGSSIMGSILAPQADINKNGSGNINGQVVAENYLHAAGEVHYYPLAADYTGGMVDCGCGNSLFTNGGMEIHDPSTTFPVNFQGNNARDLTNSNPNVITEWQPALTTQRMYYIDDVVNRVDNPEGNYFVWLPGLNDCYRTGDDIGSALGLEHGVEYVLCFYAAAWTEALDANGYPTGSNVPQKAGAVKMEFLTQSGAFIESNTFTLPKSNNWSNQDWNQYSVNFIYDSSDPVLQIYFTNASDQAGVSIDGVTLRKVDCTAGYNWSFDCNDNRRADIYAVGPNCQSNSTVTIPNSSNVYQAIVEIVYKGTYPGNSLTVTAGGTNYTLNEVPVSGGSSNVWVYRGIIPTSVSSVSFNNAPSNCSLQSILVHAFRNNVTSVKQSGILTERSGYNNIVNIDIPVATASAPRNMSVMVPISELTNDGRYLKITATSGTVSTTKYIYGPNTDYGSCCLDVLNLFLPQVPGSANKVRLTIDTRNGQNGQNRNGQSYVIAGSVTINTECVEICANGIDDDGDGLVDCNDPYCAPTDLSIDGDLQVECGNSTNLKANINGALDCDISATSIAHSTGNVSQVSASLGLPDGNGSYFFRGNSGTYTRIVWDMGQVLPAGSTVCFMAKSENPGVPSQLNVWLLTRGVPATGSYDLISSHTVSSTEWQNYCFILPKSTRYVKITDEGGDPFYVDAVAFDCDENGLLTYTWNTGANSNSIVTGPLTEPTLYSVTVTN
ncbi:MAG: choice-of-anchor A family protein, partial [Saprospiraceae bacterium]|nr:choice-of-anchor A family protein [Saprospiraceae bacterium]